MNISHVNVFRLNKIMETRRFEISFIKNSMKYLSLASNLRATRFFLCTEWDLTPSLADHAHGIVTVICTLNSPRGPRGQDGLGPGGGGGGSEII